MFFNIVVPLNFKDFTPEMARIRHIEIAKEGLRNYLSLSRDKPNYQIIVDGNLTNTESQLKPFGKITYLFLRIGQVGKLAITTARNLSPVQSGRYKKSWRLIVNNRVVEENSIPNDAEKLILVNFQPYARKIHVRGARLRGVPPGIVEKVRQIVGRQFNISFVLSVEYIELKNAYILKQNYVQTKKRSRPRLHTKRGEELTYPALVVKQKF